MERMTKKPKTVITLEERRKIIQGAILHGYDFHAICKFVGPSKSKKQIKNYFMTMASKYKKDPKSVHPGLVSLLEERQKSLQKWTKCDKMQFLQLVIKYKANWKDE